MVQKLIGAMLAIVIGLALLPIVINVIDDVTPTAFAAVDGLLGILPILYVIIIVVGAVGYIAIGRKK